MEKIICDKCNKEIKDKSKYALLGTYRGVKNKKTLAEHYFHLNCWVKLVNEKMMKRFERAKDELLSNLKDMSLKDVNLKKQNINK